MKKISLKISASKPTKHPIWIGSDLIKEGAKYITSQNYSSITLMVDRKVSKTGNRLKSELTKKHKHVHLLKIDANERVKDFRKIHPYFTHLIKNKVDRKGVLVAIGGGVVGDLTGFIAATYLRGIDWIGVPTTLLAQVDSSLGGKTGVNHPSGKNLIGAFHHPKLILCDTETLKTLSLRDRVSGFGEIMKYGLAYDKNFFRWLAKHSESILELEFPQTQKAIATSLQWKAKIVSRDEKEGGFRMTLNLGHTFGHALEAATSYRKFRHGEAIIWGMRLAGALSRVRHSLSEKSFDEIDRTLSLLPVPRWPNISLTQLVQFMGNDKKMRHGKLQFILFEKLGKVARVKNVTTPEMKSAFKLIGLPVRQK